MVTDNGRKRRRGWRIAFFVGISILVLAAGAGLFLLVLSHSGPNKGIDVAVKGIPTDWLAPRGSSQTGGSTAQAGEASALGDQILSPDQPLTGALAIVGNGKLFGEETYEIQRSADGSVHLSSHGTFSFKVLFTTVKAAFSQDLVLDRDLIPKRYTLHIKGPLNIGNRKIEGERTGDVMRVTSGDREDQVRIGREAPLVLGMFSTYTLIPLLAGSLGDREAEEF